MTKFVSEGYFPLLILLVDDDREMVVARPADIPCGKTFRVLQTNYEPPLVVNS